MAVVFDSRLQLQSENGDLFMCVVNDLQVKLKM